MWLVLKLTASKRQIFLKMLSLRHSVCVRIFFYFMENSKTNSIFQTFYSTLKIMISININYLDMKLDQLIDRVVGNVFRAYFA